MADVAPAGHVLLSGHAVSRGRMRNAFKSLARSGAWRWPVSSSPEHPPPGRQAGLTQKPRFWSDRFFSVLVRGIVGF